MIKDAIFWSIGANNVQAMYDVVNDAYGYNFTGTPTSFDRVKQCGTEALHLLPKWYLISQVVASTPIGGYFGLNREKAFGALSNFVTVENTVFALAGLSTAMVSLAYLSPKLANMIREGSKLSPKDPINIAVKRLTIGVKEALNIGCIATPIFLGYKHSYALALLATIPAHLLESELQHKIPRNAAWFKPFIPAAYATSTVALWYFTG